MGIRIERKHPRCPNGERPAQTASGCYELASPQAGAEKHKVANATFVSSLEKAADLIQNQGYSIRMECKGKRASLISPKGVRILRF